jgi:hypothetical protein
MHSENGSSVENRYLGALVRTRALAGYETPHPPLGFIVTDIIKPTQHG